MPLERTETWETLRKWCPWELQREPSYIADPGEKGFPKEDKEWRSPFAACYSLCARYRDDTNCCKGPFGKPEFCRPDYYADRVKSVCPDAETYRKWLLLPSLLDINH